jgi:hypothetical protein
MVVPSADDPATGQVLSSDAQTVYRVNGTCTCRAGEHGTMCKHRQAWQLYRHITKKVEALPTPEVFLVDKKNSPQAEVVAQCDNFPEAPASVNCHLTIDGRDCLLTLRDRDEGRLLARLAVVLAQYPAPQPPRAPASSQGETQAWCRAHQVPLHLNHGKDGRTWYSHKLPEGGFCRGKP